MYVLLLVLSVTNNTDISVGGNALNAGTLIMSPSSTNVTADSAVLVTRSTALHAVAEAIVPQTFRSHVQQLLENVMPHVSSMLLTQQTQVNVAR